MHPAPFAPQRVRCLEWYHLKRSAPALDDKDGSPRAKTPPSVKSINSKLGPILPSPNLPLRGAPRRTQIDSPDRLDRRTAHDRPRTFAVGGFAPNNQNRERPKPLGIAANLFVFRQSTAHLEYLDGYRAGVDKGFPFRRRKRRRFVLNIPRG